MTMGVRLGVAPDVAHVRVVRLVAVSLARLNGIDEESVEDVRLAVGEACGRAVNAHARAETDSLVVVDFEADTGLTVTVSDTVPLPSATGAEAAALITGDRAVAQAPADGFDSSPEVIALLESLADTVTVNTGISGTAISLHWASGR